MELSFLTEIALNFRKKSEKITHLRSIFYLLISFHNIIEDFFNKTQAFLPAITFERNNA
jgi:hypothetical protein